MSDTQSEQPNGRSQQVERLDVEDEDHWQERMRVSTDSVFMQLDSKSTPQSPPSIPKSFDFGDRRTYPVVPPSELLSRVQAFLPRLAASNTDLTRRAQEDPESVDIENLGNEGRYIEMNLGLGVFEQRDAQSSTGSSPRPHHDSDTEMRHQHSSNSSGSYDSTSTDSENDGDDSDSDTSSVDIISAFSSVIAARPIRPLPRRRTTARPEIVMLDDHESSHEMKDVSSSSSSGESQD